jgi:hypothetical protein
MIFVLAFGYFALQAMVACAFIAIRCLCRLVVDLAGERIFAAQKTKPNNS